MLYPAAVSTINSCICKVTHKIDTDDELSFAPVASFYFCHLAVVCSWTERLRRAISICSWLHRISGRLCVHWLVTSLLWVASAGVDGWRRHWTVGSALLILRSAESVGGASACVLVGRWAPEWLLIHRQRGGRR